MAVGLALAAAGIAIAAALPGIGGLVPAALAIGTGTGLVTPIGFAHLASTARPERLGQTLGAAEVGRELGDAGSPLVVGAIAAAGTLCASMGGLAVLLAAIAAA
ncbi:hypothetical protein AB0L41_48820 [Amycolatopsis mediterranei]|uniref:hypothetical protein n=1 Tax=Amycolatopsis mediterranei TaxID=33910 RepID=UPI0034171D49